jgi:predicted SAM-dependent methyltransferase
MFEHLSFVDTDRALKEWWRVLKYDGLLVMTFPDILAVCRRYFFDSMINKVFDREEKLDYEIKMIVGSQENEGMFHRNHYDRRRIRRMLPNYGFHIEFFYNFPKRTTPSLLTIARKVKASDSIH